MPMTGPFGSLLVVYWEQWLTLRHISAVWALVSFRHRFFLRLYKPD